MGVRAVVGGRHGGWGIGVGVGSEGTEGTGLGVLQPTLTVG